MIQHTITFNVCPDNAAAAAELIKRLKAAGHKAELVVHDEKTAALVTAHNKAHGNAAPAAVAHDMDADEALAIAVDVETTLTKK